VPSHCRMRAFDRDLIRGGHYGQRSCEPHLQAEHMAALTQACIREESPCQPGAVHTWHLGQGGRWTGNSSGSGFSSLRELAAKFIARAVEIESKELGRQ
jgi:hypothetical protein